MAIKMTGMATDLPIQEWIKQLVGVKEQEINKIVQQKTFTTGSKNALNTVKASYNSLLTSSEKITDNLLGSSEDLFAKKKVTSSNDSNVTATTTALTAKQNLNIFVSQLAEPTVVQSVDTTSAKIVGSTKISQISAGTVKEGEFSIYVDNQKHTISVSSDDT